jgi:hypothetical protein
MIKLECVEELGKGTIDWLTLSLRKDFGKVRIYTSTKEGIITSDSGQDLYNGYTVIRDFGETLIAFTRISKIPELYVAFRVRELENTESDEDV